MRSILLSLVENRGTASLSTREPELQRPIARLRLKVDCDSIEASSRRWNARCESSNLSLDTLALGGRVRTLRTVATDRAESKTDNNGGPLEEAIYRTTTSQVATMDAYTW